jgi:microsomal dipeptidase-like Zn-dependent dipeptidase
MKRVLGWSVAVFAIVVAAFLLLAPGIAERSMNKTIGTQATISERARALHARLTVADLHSDTLLWQRDPLTRSTRGHVDLPRLHDGHVALQVFSSVSQTPKGQNYDRNSDSDVLWQLVIAQQQPIRTWFSPLQRSLFHGEKLAEAVRESDGRLVQIRSRADLQRLLAARGAGRDVTGALFSVEGLQNLEGQFGNLARLYDAGVRMAGLTHFFDNAIAGSMHGERKGGLTPLGRQVVREMERRGMIVDIAHASHAAVADVLAMARRPVLSSHGGVQATCNVNRNLTDDEIRGVAHTGGVVGIGVWDAAVCGTEPRDTARAMRHVRDLVGIDYVALGTDYDGAVTAGYDVSRIALITQALIDEGFTDEDIAKVMGGNVQRVLNQTLPER